MTFKRKKTYITVDTDVYISDIIGEIEDDDLINELKSRNIQIGTAIDFKTREDVLLHIKSVLGLKSYHDNERVINEIKELF